MSVAPPGRALLVGLGGLGCPAALALARAGVTVLGLCDDDVVDRSNLHRQILFRDADVGQPKLDAAAAALRAISPSTTLRLHRTRLLPSNAIDIVSGYDMVVEGSDNFSTKFLVADACALAGVAVVHASAVRWIGTVLAVGPQGRPCYRCLFEDIPSAGPATSCAEAGVMGPVVGIVAAAQVDLVLARLERVGPDGEIVTYDGRTDAMRRRVLTARPDCPLCGREPRIQSIVAAAYAPVECRG